MAFYLLFLGVTYFSVQWKTTRCLAYLYLVPVLCRSKLMGVTPVLQKKKISEAI